MGSSTVHVFINFFYFLFFKFIVPVSFLLITKQFHDTNLAFLTVAALFNM